VESGFVEFLLPGRSEPARVNRYLVARGDNKTLVLYWYQSRDRVIASEYAAKFYLIADAIRYNRTDTSLIRIAVPVTGGDTETALRHATGFAQQIYRPLRQSLPS
jgi:EpsI family protein